MSTDKKKIVSFVLAVSMALLYSSGVFAKMSAVSDSAVEASDSVVDSVAADTSLDVETGEDSSTTDSAKTSDTENEISIDDLSSGTYTDGDYVIDISENVSVDESDSLADAVSDSGADSDEEEELPDSLFVEADDSDIVSDLPDGGDGVSNGSAEVGETIAPEVTDEPDPTDVPMETDAPDATVNPDATSTPEATVNPNAIDLTDDEDVVVSYINPQTYTGEAITPEPVISYGEIELVKDVDYELVYENNIEIGIAKITVSFIGSYTGSVIVEFMIVEDAEAEVMAYSCSYDSSTKTLTISGTGDMTDYESATRRNANASWASYRTKATSLVIEEGMMHIGEYCFYGFSALTSVTIPSSVTSIGS